MAVEILELFEVEARRRAADMGKVEPLGRLRAADALVVAVPPTEAEAIVVYRFGQIAHLVPIAVDAARAMPFRQIRARCAVVQPYMRVSRFAPVHRTQQPEMGEGKV